MIEENDDELSCESPGKKSDGMFNSPETSPGIGMKPLVMSEEVASSITRDICNGLF